MSNDPYTAPATNVADPAPQPIPPGWRWLRIGVAIVAAWLLASAVGLLSGVAMAMTPDLFGDDYATAAANARLVRRLALGAARVVFFLVFLRGVGTRRVAQLGLVVLGAEVFDLAASAVLFDSWSESFDWASLARHAVPAALALGLATFFQRRRKLPG